MNRIELGRLGEKIAQKYLLSQGYIIKKTNYKNSYPEIDIIAKDKAINIFVEVKTRIKSAESLKEDPLKSWQVNTIKGAIKEYAFKYKLNFDLIRLDLIIILINPENRQADLTHYKDIF